MHQPPLSVPAMVMVVALCILASTLPEYVAAQTAFSYQGRIETPQQQDVATVDLDFRLYTTEDGDTQLGDTQSFSDVSLVDGLFEVRLDFGDQPFETGLWLEVLIDDQVVQPRQPIKSVPLAIRALNVEGAVGSSPWEVESHGIHFDQGQVAVTNGSGSDPVLLVQGGSEGGAATFSTSAIDSHAIVGESLGPPDPEDSESFPSGVLGISEDGAGVRGVAAGDFAWAGYFDGPVRINGSLLVENSIFADDKSGFLVDIAINAGSSELSRGDVVVVTGVASEEIASDIPVPRVKVNSRPESSAVIGVIDRRFVRDEQGREELIEEPAAPGDYVSLVTLGAFSEIKVDAENEAIHAGDLLVSSPTPGHAMRAADPAPGTIIGKALADFASGRGRIPVLVNMQ